MAGDGEVPSEASGSLIELEGSNHIGWLIDTGGFYILFEKVHTQFLKQDHSGPAVWRQLCRSLLLLLRGNLLDRYRLGRY